MRITTTCSIWEGAADRWSYAELSAGAFADATRYAFWSKKDPLATAAAQLEADGVIARGDLDVFRREAEARCRHGGASDHRGAMAGSAEAGRDVVAGDAPRVRTEPLDPPTRLRIDLEPALPPVEQGLPFDRKGRTFLDAVAIGVADALRADPRVFVYGEDVGGRYGNSFLMLKPLLDEFGDRILNSPLAEGGVLGVCVGAALAGLRPIGEMQFNDFVASGFNQLVNNAAKIRYRWGGSVPMVVRMPWGGLRLPGRITRRTPNRGSIARGLKIVVPSTPEDARALMAAAVADPTRCSITSTSPSIATRASSRRSQPRRRHPFRWAKRRCAVRVTTLPSCHAAPTSMSRCGSRNGWRPIASPPVCSICARSRRSIERRC